MVYDGTIRSLLAKPDEIVAAVGGHAKLIQLTLPEGGLASAKGPAWFNVAMIDTVTQDRVLEAGFSAAARERRAAM